MTRILLTNDDGLGRDGIRALRRCLLAAGCRVTTIAPDANRSGVSRAVTIHDDVEVRRVEDGDDAVFACTGTPVDCVRVGLLSTLAPPIDLVVSGINHGTNLGDDVGYSGTVGAALEAATLGRCGVAFSEQGTAHAAGMDDHGGHAFVLAPVAAAIAARVAERPAAGVALSINLPAHLRDDGIAITRPGRRRYDRGWLRPHAEDAAGGTLRFRPYRGTGDEHPPHEDAPEVDFSAVLAGRIAVSLLRPLGAATADDRAWLGSLALDRVVRETAT